jgi:hypothetical protein
MAKEYCLSIPLAAIAKPLMGTATVWPGVLGGRFLDRLGLLVSRCQSRDWSGNAGEVHHGVSVCGDCRWLSFHAGEALSPEPVALVRRRTKIREGSVSGPCADLSC